MRYLKLGLRGADVRAWNQFLRGIRELCPLVVTDEFTNVTLKETRFFQRSNKLTDDGIVGPLTLAAAMNKGFNPLYNGNLDEFGPYWPPRPIFKSISVSERQKLFGKFRYRPASTIHNPEAIKITDSWVQDNLKKVIIPQLETVAGSTGVVYFHKKAEKQLIKLFQDWEDAGLSHLILGWAGSWSPRFIRGSRTILSNHAWATAFDINVPWNYLGTQPALKGKKGSVRELVPIANNNGFYWGGHFSGRPDGMHFEVAKIID